MHKAWFFEKMIVVLSMPFFVVAVFLANCRGSAIYICLFNSKLVQYVRKDHRKDFLQRCNRQRRPAPTRTIAQSLAMCSNPRFFKIYFSGNDSTWGYFTVNEIRVAKFWVTEPEFHPRSCIGALNAKRFRYICCHPWFFMAFQAHIGSRTVFENFPNHEKYVGKPVACDFSPNSKYFAVGNYDGVVKLFRWVSRSVVFTGW